MTFLTCPVSPQCAVRVNITIVNQVCLVDCMLLITSSKINAFSVNTLPFVRTITIHRKWTNLCLWHKEGRIIQTLSNSLESAILLCSTLGKRTERTLRDTENRFDQWSDCLPNMILIKTIKNGFLSLRWQTSTQHWLQARSYDAFFTFHIFNSWFTV